MVVAAHDHAKPRLGSLVPSPQYLWRSGPDAMEFTPAAEHLGSSVEHFLRVRFLDPWQGVASEPIPALLPRDLIAFVQGGLLEGQRSEESDSQEGFPVQRTSV